MPLTITNESKNSLIISNESKTGDTTTWAEHTETWAEAGTSGTTWATPGLPITKESKNDLTISNESKN